MKMSMVETVVKRMHDAGYVHGDLQLLNILVDLCDLIKIIDFDWSGEGGKVVYPPFMNNEIDWHPETKFGGLIRPEHDLYILKNELNRYFD